MLKEFKQFLLRGNVVDLAVGVVIGSAFGAIVSALVSDLFTPFVSVIVKLPDFNSIDFTINGSRFAIGHFLNALISFFLVAGAVFFFVIKPMNILVGKFKKNPEPDSGMKICPECASGIPKEAKRCKFCTQAIKD